MLVTVVQIPKFTRQLQAADINPGRRAVIIHWRPKDRPPLAQLEVF